MQSLKPYIALGWHTVPLKGELKRLSNGKKTIPEFPKNFKEFYTENKNETNSSLGGVMCGKCSNLIAIDCDNEAAYNIFKALDPTNEAVLVSVGKTDALGNEIKAATFLYQYHEELDENFIVKNDKINLDFYSNKGFIYLPTVANKTKVAWEYIPEIKPVPHEVLALLKSLKPVKLKVTEAQLQTKRWKTHLAPQVQKFVANRKVTKELFKILTPKDFRTTPEYLANEFLYPRDVEDGRGSEYLSKVSAILGADESIDEELYCKAMELLNDLFLEPMPKKRLQATIIEPMVEERASIDGEPIWKYNENWEANITTVVTKINSSLNVFFDMNRRIWYAVDIGGEKVQAFKKDTEFYSFLETVSADELSKSELRLALPLVTAVSTPEHPFGFYGEYADTFNTFVPTIPLSIFKDPESYAKNYSYPSTVLTFLQHLVPDDYMRNYLLKFLRRKLDTFDYSPVVLYFLGVSGSGKDTFVRILETIMGVENIAKPSAEEFIETHNGWILDKYFAQLDEYGDQLSKFADKEIAKGKIKTYSGKSHIQVRSMRNDGFPYEHSVTFIMTANTNPLTFDEDDRRIALFSTPNNLRSHPLVEEIGLEEFHARLDAEINDFCYWLATKVENLAADDYMCPPESMDKKLVIAAALNAGNRIAYLLNNKMFSELERLAAESEIKSIIASEGRIYEDDLLALYMELTDGNGTKRGLTLAMKPFEKVPTTRNGSKSYYYKVPGLDSYRKATKAVTPIEGDFE